MATTDRDKARDLLRGWQAAHQVQNRDGSSAVSASGPLTLARQAWRSRRAVATMGDGGGRSDGA